MRKGSESKKGLSDRHSKRPPDLPATSTTRSANAKHDTTTSSVSTTPPLVVAPSTTSKGLHRATQATNDNVGAVAVAGSSTAAVVDPSSSSIEKKGLRRPRNNQSTNAGGASASSAAPVITSTAMPTKAGLRRPAKMTTAHDVGAVAVAGSSTAAVVDPSSSGSIAEKKGLRRPRNNQSTNADTSASSAAPVITSTAMPTKAGLRRPTKMITTASEDNASAPAPTTVPTKAGLARNRNHPNMQSATLSTDSHPSSLTVPTKAGLARNRNPNTQSETLSRDQRHQASVEEKEEEEVDETHNDDDEEQGRDREDDDDPTSSAGMGFPARVNNNQALLLPTPSERQNLVHAQPVTDDEEQSLTEARPVDLEELEQKRLEKKKTTQKWTAILLFVGFLICLAVVLGVVLRQTTGNPSTKSVVATMPPPRVNITTTASSSSMMPSSAPTSLVDVILDNFRTTQLPNFTLQSLQDPHSPQTRAYERVRDHWLLQEQQTRNLTDELEDWRLRQVFALYTFYYSYQGGLWPPAISKSWLDQDADPCNWYSSSYAAYDESTGTYGDPFKNDLWGSACNGNGQLQVLHMENLFPNKQNHSSHTIIPPEVSFLTNLEDLILEKSLVGSLTSEIGLLRDLRRLTNLRLQNNHFMTGTIPTEIGLLSSLYWVYIKENDILNGSIPSEIGLWRRVKYLEMQESNLGGALPTDIGHMTSMEILWLNDNSLTGPIPSEIGQSSSSYSIRLDDNPFSGGPLPSELGSLSELEHFYMMRTLQTGTLPTELGRLSQLKTLQLPHCLLSGSLPSQLGLMWQGSFGFSDFVCDLSHNLLGGMLPSHLGLLTKLEKLYLNHNLLTGVLPSEIGLLASLENLQLQSNNFSSSVPSTLALMTYLDALDLSDNGFTGPLPSEIGLLSYLGNLQLHSNNLSSSVPSALALMTSLRTLDLSHNGFTGPLPTEIGVMTKLDILNVSYNMLTNIPSELGSIGEPTTTEICLQGNILVGDLPNELCPWACQSNAGAESPSCWEQYCAERESCGCDCSEYWFSWPGRFPANNSTGAVNINIRHDSRATETEWSLEQSVLNSAIEQNIFDSEQQRQQRNPTQASNQAGLEGAEWKLVANKTSVVSDVQFGTTSYGVVGLLPLTRYKLNVTDNDGIRGGWVTITNGTASGIYEGGTLLWSLSADDLDGSVTVYIWVTAEGETEIVDA